jgi:membrane-associated phospholipid phosphatase
MNWILNALGANGPIILFFINILCLTQYLHKYGIFYVFFIFIDALLNMTLKGIIREPRPLGYKTNNEVYHNLMYRGIHKYGMPSGHAESTMFSLTYIGLVTKSPLLIVLEIGIACIVLYQRWATRKHSIMQLFVGSIVGCIMGLLCYIIVDKTQIEDNV